MRDVELLVEVCSICLDQRPCTRLMMLVGVAGSMCWVRWVAQKSDANAGAGHWLQLRWGVTGEARDSGSRLMLLALAVSSVSVLMLRRRDTPAGFTNESCADALAALAAAASAAANLAASAARRDPSVGSEARRLSSADEETISGMMPEKTTSGTELSRLCPGWPSALAFTPVAPVSTAAGGAFFFLCFVRSCVRGEALVVWKMESASKATCCTGMLAVRWGLGRISSSARSAPTAGSPPAAATATIGSGESNGVL
jgi:hypothetical protein